VSILKAISNAFEVLPPLPPTADPLRLEPVSSIEDMDAKALHAARMCKVAP